MMTVNVPNDVLDLHTLKFVLSGVMKRDRLIAGEFRRKRRVLGFIPFGEECCAVGAAGAPSCSIDEPDDSVFWDWANANDLDPHTIASITAVNDAIVGSAELRWSMMVNWLCRCIAYAENVKWEIEKLGSSSTANVNTQLAADKAKAA